MTVGVLVSISGSDGVQDELGALEPEHTGHVIEMREDELEVVVVTDAAEELGAVTFGQAGHVGSRPDVDELLCPFRLGFVASLYETFGDPGATERILLAELTAGAGAHDSHAGVPADQGGDLRQPVAKARGVDHLTL